MLLQPAQHLRTLWKYRGFIRTSVVNDIRTRFCRSNMGGIWMIVQPLAQSAIFALVLSVIMKARLPGIEDTRTYAAYLLSGMLCWSLFSESVSRGLTLFLESAPLIKKISFPVLTLPVISGLISLTNNAFLLLATVVVLAILGIFPTSHIVMLPLLIGTTLGLGLAVGVFFGIINVFIRDLGVIIPIALQFAFWFCPIVYSPANLPEGFREILRYNPVAWLVGAYQDVLVFGNWPGPQALLPAFILGLGCWSLVLLLLRRCYGQMVDIL